MSNEIKRAIDTNLNGLYVTERNVQTILRSARMADAPQEKRRPNFGFAAVIAAVMVMVLAGTAWTMAGRIGGRERPMPLSGQEQGEMLLITQEEAIALAEDHIHLVYGAYVSLRDETKHRITCELHGPDLHAGSSHYRVVFAALTTEGTDYTVDVLAAQGAEDPVVSSVRERGVGEGHTPAEMRHGYSRLYGTDLTKWPYDVLNRYCTDLTRADSYAKTWADHLFRRGTFCDPATETLPPEAAQATSAVLMRSGDRTIWKLAIPEAPGEDGITWVRLVEKDAKTGEIVSDIRLDESNVGFLPLIATQTIRDNEQNATGTGGPSLFYDRAKALAEDHIRTRYGETRDLTDPAVYACTRNTAVKGLCSPVLLLYDPVSRDAPAYWVVLDWNGVVQDSGMCTARTDGLEDLDSLRYAAAWRPYYDESDTPFFRIAEDYEYEELAALQTLLRQRGDRDDPVARLIADTQYAESVLEDYDAGALEDEYLNAKTTRSLAYGHRVHIVSGDRHIRKTAVYTDRGVYILEIDETARKVTHAVRVENLADCWWALFLPQEAMEAAGVAPEPYTLPENDGSTAIDAPYIPVSGTRIDYLNTDFRHIYTPDLSDWTQEQLRTWQQYAITADGIDGDMGIFALRHTWYPDVPKNAISREEAAEKALARIALPGYEMDGAVLIGTQGNPVWKVCLRHESGPFWYAEVDCITGEVLEVKAGLDEAATELPVYSSEGVPEYWYRNIVLEETIRECEEVWVRLGNG